MGFVFSIEIGLSVNSIPHIIDEEGTETHRYTVSQAKTAFPRVPFTLRVWLRWPPEAGMEDLENGSGTQPCALCLHGSGEATLFLWVEPSCWLTCEQTLLDVPSSGLSKLGARWVCSSRVKQPVLLCIVLRSVAAQGQQKADERPSCICHGIPQVYFPLASSRQATLSSVFVLSSLPASLTDRQPCCLQAQSRLPSSLPALRITKP